MKLTLHLDGNDPKQTARRRWLWEAGETYDNSGIHFSSREEKLKRHLETFFGIHRKFTDDGFQPQPNDIMMMSNVARNQGGMGLHFGAFVTTLTSQATMEQQMEWLLPAFQMKIIGALGQTELGHGSNVRGLQTTAEYDASTQEFVLNTPFLKSMKWWPGNLGKTSTHCLVYAQLVVGGQEKGFHVFMIQLRDDNHKPLAGIEVGEVGPKIGDNGTETGFLRLHNVRIPRTWMMMKNQEVTPEGEYKKNPKVANSKIQYTTMLNIRAGLVMSGGYRLAAAVTIAARYSCVRVQGFVDTNAASDRTAPENKIMEYQNQQYRLLKQLALAYAFTFTGQTISLNLQKLMKDILENSDTSGLAEMHAISSGLKSLVTFEGAAGMEECRKLCGGHGVLLASGVAQMALDYTTYCTAEGDRIILELQSARYLVKALGEARQGKPVSGLCEYLVPCKDPKYDPTSELNCKATTTAGFRDLNVLRKLFRARALNAVVEVGDRLRSLLESKVQFDAAWNRCSIDLVTASRAHCYYVILVNFIESLGNCKDDKVRNILTHVCVLFALQNIQEDMGSFTFTKTQQKLVREAVREVLPIVRADVIPLTDAFEFPDQALGSAIGKHDGKVFEALYESAKASPMNRQDPFPGYEEILRPNLDLEFIKDHAQMQRSGPIQRGKL